MPRARVLGYARFQRAQYHSRLANAFLNGPAPSSVTHSFSHVSAHVRNQTSDDASRSSNASATEGTSSHDNPSPTATFLETGLLPQEHPNFRIIAAALLLVFEDIDDERLEAESQSITTFDCSINDKLVIQYQAALEECAREQNIAEEKLVKDFNASRTRGEGTYPWMDRIDGILLELRIAKEQLLHGCIVPLQLFNAQKGFGFQEDTVFRQDLHDLLNNPEQLLLQQDDTDCIQTANVATYHGKERAFLDSLRVFEQNHRQFTEMISVESKNIATRPAEAPTFVPGVQVEFEGILVPSNLPSRIRERLQTLENLGYELGYSQKVVRHLRDSAKALLIYWVHAGSKTWRYGKSHIHEIPLMRWYEYVRTDREALIVIAQHEVKRVVQYFTTARGSRRLTPELKEAFDSAFKLNGQALFHDEVRWESNRSNFRKDCPPVDILVSKYDKLDQERRSG